MDMLPSSPWSERGQYVTELVVRIINVVVVVFAVNSVEYVLIWDVRILQFCAQNFAQNWTCAELVVIKFCRFFSPILLFVRH